MKKRSTLAIVAALVLCLVCCTASAAGKMTVLQENFHAVDFSTPYGYVFAKVENTGDKPVKYSAGLLEIYDANGDTLESTDWVGCYPSILNPGETGFAIVSERVENASAVSDLDDYALTVTGKSATSGSVTRYPVKGEYQQDVQISTYSTRNYLIAEITNDTDTTAFDVELVFTILDDNGNILYAEHNSLYSIGINPGSTVTYRTTLSDSWKETWEHEGVTPTKLEIIAYTENK